ncbi:MAG TPA: HD domain-containing protein [Chroococcales cyanobacterium]
MTDEQKLSPRTVETDPAVLELCDKGDANSSSQTYHDRNHMFQVRDVAVALAAKINELTPGKIDAHTQDTIIPIAALLHDIGRGIDVDNHASAGARWARVYLKKLGFDKDTVRKIARVIACHRSEVVLKPRSFRAANFGDAAWAIVVMADKAVGDEDRVRPEPRKELARLRKANKMSEFGGSIHDRINYAIKSAELCVDGRGNGAADPGVIVLKFKLDKVVATPDEVYGLYGSRFHACGKAAQYLGFVFRLEFNGERYAYDKTSNTWTKIESISVPLS